MTIQEFVKKESENSYAYVGFGDAQYNYSLGLTKGLEITKELIMSISGCKEQTAIKYIEDSLTEKYGK